jgi:hypothetical protein
MSSADSSVHISWCIWQSSNIFLSNCAVIGIMLFSVPSVFAYLYVRDIFCVESSLKLKNKMKMKHNCMGWGLTVLFQAILSLIFSREVICLQ